MMKLMMKGIMILICFFSTNVFAADALVGGQIANLGSLATIVSANYEAKGANEFSWAVKVGNLSYAWENTYNSSGTGFEQEDGSGLYLSVDFYKYFDHALEGIYFGAGYGISMIDWKYKDENTKTGTIWSTDSGSATVTESHLVIGSKIHFDSVIIDPSIVFGSFLSASTSGQEMLGIFFLPSLAIHVEF
ncbi:MAG: hypothetical protein R8M45_04050 [Ghiorsea sp.]